MDDQAFLDLPADRHQRIERGDRFLEDHRQLGAAQQPAAFFADADQIGTAELNPAPVYPRHLGKQPHHGKGGHRLAASGFSDQREDLARIDRKRDPVHHRVAADRDRKIADVEDWPGHRTSSAVAAQGWFGCAMATNSSPSRITAEGMAKLTG
ncbi:hypothetical protein D3C80_812980 [compost metagenome]